MGKPGELKNPNFKPILPAPADWKLSQLGKSYALKTLPETLPGVPEKPAGIQPKISELELAQKLLYQIEKADKLACTAAACGAGRFFKSMKFFSETELKEKIRAGFIKGFIKSINNPERPIGRQNLRLATYCSKPENIIFGFKKLVEEGVKITVNKGGKILHEIKFNDLQGPGTGDVFRKLVKDQCGEIEGLEEYYKPIPIR